MAGRLQSVSVADEFIVCVKCHCPVDVQRCSPVLASTPCPKKAYNGQYTSTPQGVLEYDDDSSEQLRQDKQSYSNATCRLLDEFVKYPNTSLLTRSQSTTESLLSAPESLLSEETDFELSEEYLPGYFCPHPEPTNAFYRSCTPTFCHRCETETFDGQTNFGSRMSLYFPDKTGADVADDVIKAGRCDSMCCSTNSDDSGACDIDGGLPVIHDCRTPAPGSTSTRRQRHGVDNAKNRTPCDTDHNNSSSYYIVNTPKTMAAPRENTASVKRQTEDIADDIATELNMNNVNIERIRNEVEEKFAVVRRHLESARTYYHEMVEQWFWKNVIVLDGELEKVKDDQQRQAELREAAMARIKVCVNGVEREQKHKHGVRYGEDLNQNLRQLSKHVQELRDLSEELTEVTFIAGRCERLSGEHLGSVVVQRCPKHQHAPQGVLPSRCLWSFDSRQGRSSRYAATGLSVTPAGDLLVTDTGMDTVNVFSNRGVKKLNVNTAPGDHPTTAVQLGDVIAVACSGEVKLYGKDDGIYHSKQPSQCLCRPQGVATDGEGHLVVSGYRIDLPAIAVYDRDTYLLNEVITGDNKCALASEDTIGSELNEPANEVIFSKPWYVVIGQSDEFIVSDRDSHTVCVINRRGELIEEIGSPGHKPGEFFYPAGLCIDRQGGIIIADSENNRVQMVTSDRRTVLSILTQEHDSLDCPMDVALDKNGLLYVLQSDGLVRVFQYC